MIQLEICCNSYGDALVASRCAIKRIELNSGIYLGGLTPSLGSLVQIKEHTDLEVMSMVRPRGAGFLYSEAEYEQMSMDAKLLIKYGSDGIVFGFLKEDLTVCMERTRTMVELAHENGKTAVFHRAFDLTENPYAAMEMLIRLGVDRVLTSGQASTAEEGILLLKDLQAKYGNEIEILAGCGIGAHNARKIMTETGITQIHGSCKEWMVDPTTSGNTVSFAYDPGGYEVASACKIKEIQTLL